MTDIEGWEPTRWWRAVTPAGELWAESSSEEEVRERARPTDIVQQLYSRTETVWVSK